MLSRIVLHVLHEFDKARFQRFQFPRFGQQVPDHSLAEQKLVPHAILGERHVVGRHARVK